MGSLRFRTALVLTTVVVVSLLANAIILVPLGLREERRDIETSAWAFARLATRPIAESAVLYSSSARMKLDEIVARTLADSPDGRGVVFATVEGDILFASRGTEANLTKPPSHRKIDDARVREAVAALSPVLIPAKAGEEAFMIVSPWIEEWGVHRYSVVFRFSYANVWPRSLARVKAGSTIAALAILFSLVLGYYLMARITRPLERLTEGVRAVAAGRFGQTIDLEAEGEVRALADAFNQMSLALEQSVVAISRSNEDLAKANRDLLERNSQLEEFAYTISHDLKTPLVTIQGFVGHIEEGLRSGNTERLQDDVKRVRTAAARMYRLLAELLTISRAGLETLHPRPVSMLELAREAVEHARGILGHATVRIDPEIPGVLGDRVRLGQVMQNLLDNAAKFTVGRENAQIDIGFRTESDGTVFLVSDNGVGIGAGKAERAFLLFEKLEPQSEGTGIGLTLVRRVVQAHGGRVWIESEGEGLGTRVCFTIPTPRQTTDAA
jgi:signal transduction histidine kinase